MKMIRTKWLVGFTLAMVLFAGCGGKEYKKIELDQLSPELRQLSDQITEDFFTLVLTPEGLIDFKRKDYITPLVHAGIMSQNGIYAYAPEIILLELGEVDSWQLFQVVDKGIVKTFRYKLSCQRRPDEFVEFKIDINRDNKLAAIYTYVYVDEAKTERRNLFFK